MEGTESLSASKSTELALPEVLTGVEIPPAVVEVYHQAMWVFGELERQADGVELGTDIRVGFAEDLARATDEADALSVFLNYFNQIFIEHDLEGTVDASELLEAAGLLEPEE